jgi:hypothetical protein
MAYTLYTGQIIEALRALDRPEADFLITSLHQLTDQAASLLAASLQIERGCLSELWDSNAAVTFAPAYDGQPLPDVMDGMDSESEWV